MKKSAVFCAAVLAAAAVLLTACSARTPVSSDDFQKKAEAAGFTVAADASGSSDGVKSLSAVKSDADTEISFFEFSDGASAQDRYAALKKEVSASGDGNTVDSSAYNKYVGQNGEIYYTLVRMDNTVLSCKGTVTNKKLIDDFVGELKY